MPDFGISLVKAFCARSKTLKFGTKFPYFGIFGLKIEHNTATLKTSALKMVQLQSIVQK